MNRRSLFKKLLNAAAIVASAPQLAFRVRPEIPVTCGSITRARIQCLSAPELEALFSTPKPPYDTFLNEGVRLAELKYVAATPEPFQDALKRYQDERGLS